MKVGEIKLVILILTHEHLGYLRRNLSVGNLAYKTSYVCLAVYFSGAENTECVLGIHIIIIGIKCHFLELF